MPEVTKGELSFIDQFTRTKMIDWANDCVLNGKISEKAFLPDTCPYSKHALQRGWITKRTPARLTEAGWACAASFLKR